jgi:hypothetical protein
MMFEAAEVSTGTRLTWDQVHEAERDFDEQRSHMEDLCPLATSILHESHDPMMDDAPTCARNTFKRMMGLGNPSFHPRIVTSVSENEPVPPDTQILHLPANCPQPPNLEQYADLVGMRLELASASPLTQLQVLEWTPPEGHSYECDMKPWKSLSHLTLTGSFIRLSLGDQLRYLWIDALHQMPFWPTGNLQNLQELRLWCANVVEIPALPKCQYLWVRDCKKLEVIRFGPRVQSLEVTSCPVLTRLQYDSCTGVQDDAGVAVPDQEVVSALACIRVEQCPWIGCLPPSRHQGFTNVTIKSSGLLTLNVSNIHPLCRWILEDLPMLSTHQTAILRRAAACWLMGNWTDWMSGRCFDMRWVRSDWSRRATVSHSLHEAPSLAVLQRFINECYGPLNNHLPSNRVIPQRLVGKTYNTCALRIQHWYAKIKYHRHIRNLFRNDLDPNQFGAMPKDLLHIVLGYVGEESDSQCELEAVNEESTRVFIEQTACEEKLKELDSVKKRHETLKKRSRELWERWFQLHEQVRIKDEVKRQKKATASKNKRKRVWPIFHTVPEAPEAPRALAIFDTQRHDQSMFLQLSTHLSNLQRAQPVADSTPSTENKMRRSCSDTTICCSKKARHH